MRCVMRVMCCTIAAVVGVVCRCTAKAGLRRSARGLSTCTLIVITAQTESKFVIENDLIPFGAIFSSVTLLQMDATVSGFQWQNS
ncbi:hypothetical protein TNCV_2458581 [Trichonephila clavipes]|nr:hypothetical protein TNCV_2458581 [Trichonephila clavipes]